MSTLIMPSGDIENNLVIRQANLLAEARYTLTTDEQRLVFVMISMINPWDTDFKEYVLEAKYLPSYLGVSKKSVYGKADEITTRIMSRVLRIPKGEKGFIKYNWINKAEYSDGKLILSFHSDLKPYLLSLKEKYTTYGLNILTTFKSFYTIRIYMNLKAHAFKKEKVWRVSLEELKEILGIEKGEYSNYKDFRKRVIDQAKKELKKKNKQGVFFSDLSFDLKTFKTGRYITDLEFWIVEQTYQEALPLEIKERPKEIDQLIYYGISEEEAYKYFANLGEEIVKGCISYYKDKIDKKQVENISSGGYLISILEAGKNPISQVMIDHKEKKNDEQNKILEKNQEEALFNNYTTDRKEALFHYVDGIEEHEKESIILEYVETSHFLNTPNARNNLKKQGLKSNLQRFGIIAFLEEKELFKFDTFEQWKKEKA